MAESNKQRWARLRNVEFVNIETRPSRDLYQKDNKCWMSMNWIPSQGLGACRAFQKLIEACRGLKGEEAAHFYSQLYNLAKEECERRNEDA